MELKLKSKPQKPIIIEGFPGLGLVGSIAAEFLIDHLKAEQIGCFYSEKITPIVAIHKGKVLEQFGIFYAKKENIVILRPLVLATAIEWELTDSIIKLADMLKAKEIISLEGIETGKGKEPEAFFFTSDKKKARKLQGISLTEIKEGIVVGVTASLLSKQPDSTFLFAETHSELPDSRAAAKLIEVLDKYLELKIDYKPLLEKAETFEKKLKEILTMAVQKSKDRTAGETYLG